MSLVFRTGNGEIKHTSLKAEKCLQPTQRLVFADRSADTVPPDTAHTESIFWRILQWLV